jgi:hypothetical protein
MQFSKRTFFLVFNGIIAAGLMIYMGLWLISAKTDAKIIRPYKATTVTFEYSAHGKKHTGTELRYGIPFEKTTIPIRYFVFNHAASRVNSFMGIAAEPLGWWGIFLVATAMLFLTNNTVFSKGTRFYLQPKFPWISMEEYFPAAPAEYGQDGFGKKRRPSKSLVKKRLESGSAH